MHAIQIHPNDCEVFRLPPERITLELSADTDEVRAEMRLVIFQSTGCLVSFDGRWEEPEGKVNYRVRVRGSI